VNILQSKEEGREEIKDASDQSDVFKMSQTWWQRFWLD